MFIDGTALGVDAADALRKAIYTRLEIGVERKRIVVTGTTGFGDDEPISIAERSEDAFERLGLNGYLADQQPEGIGVRERAKRACGKSGNYTPIYSETDGAIALRAGTEVTVPPPRPAPLREWKKHGRNAKQRRER